MRLPVYDLQHARRLLATAKRLPMYEVRFSMYDLNYSAPEAREFGRASADGQRGYVVPQGRTGRVEADGVCLCTTYDVGCTI